MRLMGLVFLVIALVCFGVVLQAFAVAPLMFAVLFTAAGSYLTFHKGPLQ